ncbi:MAG: acetyl-CoA carboxylase biotin carboxyl carrier protein subunit [Anaerolineae bacterium]
MTSYYVTIGEQEYKVNVTEAGLFLNDEPVQCDLVSLNDNGLHQLSRGQQRLEVHLSAQSRHTYEVLIGGRRVIAHVTPGNHHARRTLQAAQAGAVTTPMPGLVVDVLVQEGNVVQKGDVLVVQEAMKMQMELRAPCDGRVARVAVEIGAQVEKDALLIQVAPGEET